MLTILGDSKTWESGPAMVFALPSPLLSRPAREHCAATSRRPPQPLAVVSHVLTRTHPMGAECRVAVLSVEGSLSGLRLDDDLAANGRSCCRVK